MEMIPENTIELLKQKTPIQVGNRLKSLRKSKGISQTYIAYKTGKDRQYIYKIETGKVNPTISTIALIALALNVSLEDIFKSL